MSRFNSLYGPPKRVNKKTISFEPMAGSDIDRAILEAIAAARGFGLLVRVVFNGVTFTVSADSKPVLIYRDWLRALNGYTSKKVGPSPKPMLTQKEIDNDARIEKKNQRKREAYYRNCEAKAKDHRKRVEKKMVGAPAIELGDEARWQKFRELNVGVGGGIMTYCERWAQLMQIEMTNGKKIEDVAEATSHEADLEGMSGSSYGYALGVLAVCWKYGEQLRRWHNLKYQLGNEGEKANKTGGVLNPSMLCISLK